MTIMNGPRERSRAALPRWVRTADALVSALVVLASAVAIGGAVRWWLGPWRVSIGSPVRLAARRGRHRSRTALAHAAAFPRREAPRRRAGRLAVRTGPRVSAHRGRLTGRRRGGRPDRGARLWLSGRAPAVHRARQRDHESVRALGRRLVPGHCHLRLPLRPVVWPAAEHRVLPCLPARDACGRARRGQGATPSCSRVASSCPGPLSRRRSCASSHSVASCRRSPRASAPASPCCCSRRTRSPCSTARRARRACILLCAVGAFLSAHRRRWGWVAALGVVAGLSRPNGFLLTLPLLVLLLEQHARRPRPGAVALRVRCRRCSRLSPACSLFSAFIDLGGRRPLRVGGHHGTMGPHVRRSRRVLAVARPGPCVRPARLGARRLAQRARRRGRSARGRNARPGDASARPGLRRLPARQPASAAAVRRRALSRSPHVDAVSYVLVGSRRGGRTGRSRRSRRAASARD